jgi:hypothetical protein
MLKLVYGCLAFSLIAGVIIFVLAVEQGRSFRGMTKTMGDAISQGATILDADRNGAVTQTGNGRLKGYARAGGAQWETKVDRFAEGPSNPFGAGSNDASAWCNQTCPAAIVEFEGVFSAFGGADPKLAESLDGHDAKPEDILGFAGAKTVFLRKLVEGFAQPRLVASEAGKPDAVLTVINPSEIQPDRARDRVVSGSATDKIGSLNQIVRRGGIWRVAGRSISEAGLKNICVSDDDAWIGAVTTRFSRFASGGTPRSSFGPPITTGTCTVDQQGITAIYTPVADPNKLQATRYSASGRRLWQHDFGAQRLLSPAGSPDVVAQAADGTVTALDAITGRAIFERQVVGQPFVGNDGSIVVADRQGEPEWLHVGKAPAR